jgi:hypothetical protein
VPDVSDPTGYQVDWNRVIAVGICIFCLLVPIVYIFGQSVNKSMVDTSIHIYGDMNLQTDSVGSVRMAEIYFENRGMEVRTLNFTIDYGSCTSFLVQNGTVGNVTMLLQENPLVLKPQNIGYCRVLYWNNTELQMKVI